MPKLCTIDTIWSMELEVWPSLFFSKKKKMIIYGPVWMGAWSLRMQLIIISNKAMMYYIQMKNKKNNKINNFKKRREERNIILCPSQTQHFIYLFAHAGVATYCIQTKNLDLHKQNRITFLPHSRRSCWALTNIGANLVRLSLISCSSQ